MLDGGDHEVADLISSDPGRGCHEAHGFAVAAVQREGDSHAFAVIAGHLEAVGTPSQVRLGDGDAAVVATLGPTLIHSGATTPGGVGYDHVRLQRHARSFMFDAALVALLWSMTS